MNLIGCPTSGFSDLKIHEPGTPSRGAVVERDLRSAFAAGAPQIVLRLQVDPQRGLVPRASERRSDISAEMPALQFRMRESVTRETRKRAAASLTCISPSHSRNTRPGCAGLNISAMVAPRALTCRTVLKLKSAG